MSKHDVIIGDFGRQGTLRYFQEFSRFEKEVIMKSLNEKEFFDEYRTLKYTVAGLLPEIKKEFIKQVYADSKVFDSRILIGSKNGQSPMSFVGDFLEHITPYVASAISTGATEIRIIIPCNTLAPLSIRLDELFKDYIESNNMSGRIKISVPNIPSVVIKNVTSENLYLIGTPSAFKAYEKEIFLQNLNIKLSGGSDEELERSEQIILNCIRGRETMDLIKKICYPSSSIVSACTDVSITDTIDSLSIFAQEMAYEAYKELEEL